MDLFDKFPIYYKEYDTENSRGSVYRMSILRLDTGNSGLFLSGWCNDEKVLVESCYEFNGWKDVTGLESVKDHYENSPDWIKPEIVGKEYFDIAIQSLIDREVKFILRDQNNEAQPRNQNHTAL